MALPRNLLFLLNSKQTLGAPPLNRKKVIIINILTLNLMALRPRVGGVMDIFNQTDAV